MAIRMTGLLCLIFVPALLFGQRENNATAVEEDRTLSPGFFIDNDDGGLEHFPLLATDVQVKVNGVIAEVTVRQNYHNGGKHPIHGRYVFPASTKAAVHAMSMQVGDEIVRAKVKEKEVAQKEFEQAKAEGKSASLLKQHRPNVFSMDVSNIMPGDTITIELKYTEHLVPQDGTYEFVYPTVVGPRYSNQPEKTAADSDKWIANPYLRQGVKTPSQFSLTTVVTSPVAIKNLASPSHKITTVWEDALTARLKLDNDETEGGNRDFILRYRLSGGTIASGLMLNEINDEKFFLLTVQPPERVKVDQIPPREYIFVVDVSGSMHGFPLNTSKKLLRNLIGNLRDQDCFNVILFAGLSSMMAPRSVKATKENIDNAIALIDNRNGGGGTELAPALTRALQQPSNDGSSRNIIVVTDGYIGGEREVFSLIRKNLGEANVFAFGIGTAVNRYLIDGIAKSGMGEPFVVTDPSEASGTAEQFRTYISCPVLTDIKVDYGKFDVYDVEPSSFPDLLAQRPLVIFGKYRGAPKGRITITGNTGYGTFNKEVVVGDVKPKEENIALQYLWARTRIAVLDDYCGESQREETKKEITSLGLTYNLLTRYTSFIAVLDKVRNHTGAAQDVVQPLPLPEKVSEFAVGNGNGMRKVPEPGLLELCCAIGALMLAMLWLKLTTRSKYAAAADSRFPGC